MATNSSELEQSQTTSKTVSGTHKWKVEGYSLNQGIGINQYLTSATFTIGGHSWVIAYFPDGLTNYGKSYLGFYLKLKYEGKQVEARYNLTMLDKSGNPSTLSYSSPVFTFGSNCKGWGPCSKFIKRETFETSDYLKNDCFTMKCTIFVTIGGSNKFEPIMVPPPNLNKQLCQLFEAGEGADATFKVRGQSFKAHKFMLAARSPVFRAQFFGPMNKKRKRSITIDDIEPEVFKIFLHFIYSDSLTELEEGDSIMYQHLLVAADQYNVERLKLMYEDKLSKNIEMNNLATTLTLAEQHNCSTLKASCFKFISSPKFLAEVMNTEGFEHLTRSCPSILNELLENLSDNK
ncbi:hypothetical protein LUZ60_008213 [Juncus effusus]|nr:hypothetical protein LUZ60_008213 [Juncus effusus]